MALPALAHTIDVNQIHLVVGEACLWKITADEFETTTTYTPILGGGGGVTVVTPSRIFQAHHGDFLVRGLAPGTNVLTVAWFYPRTPAAGAYQVTIIVTAPIPGQTSFQTSQGNGQLCTAEFGKYIEARTVRAFLDYYVPAQTPKLMVLTECFGGNLAKSPFFVNLANTAIASSTSPNQEGRTGGYEDDAIRVLAPVAGRTAADVHEAGSIGRQTVEPQDNPQNIKQDGFILSEWPISAGAVDLANFPLDPVSTNGPIESRHIVMYCGNPIDKAVRVEVHGGHTIPTSEGQKMAFGDVLDREKLKQNFAGEPNTTITTAGGPPQEDNRSLGENGWDYSGTLGGLEAAIRQAGDAIKKSPHPEKEQFILYIGDHGMMGNLGGPPAPARPSKANSRSELAPAFQSFSTGSPAVFFMEQEPLNVPGFLLFLQFPDAPVPIPSFLPGQLQLEVKAEGREPKVLRDFIGDAADVDQDNQLGPREGEGYSLFYPVHELEFLDNFVDRPLAITFVNNSPHSFNIAGVEQVTGSIERSWTPFLRPLITAPVLEGNGFRFTVKGQRGKSYMIRSSTDLVNWNNLTTLLLNAEVGEFRDASPAGAKYYRAEVVE